MEIASRRSAIRATPRRGATEQYQRRAAVRLSPLGRCPARHGVVLAALLVAWGGFALAESASGSLTYIPISPDSFSGGISGDGSTIFQTDSTWRDGVVEKIIFGGVDYTIATNGDGTVFGGSQDSSAFDEHRGWIWSRTTGKQYLDVGALEPVVSVNGVSSDGKYFAVTSIERPVGATIGFHDCYDAVQCTYKVYRYSQANGYESIGQIGIRPAGNGTWGLFASGISGDGNAIAGNVIYEPGFGSSYTSVPFLWRSGTGLVTLAYLADAPSQSPNGLPSGRYATAIGISRDGATVFGESADANNRIQAVYWRNGSITGLGFIPGTSDSDFGSAPRYVYRSSAVAANADGSIIVGDQSKPFESLGVQADSLAWRWTSATGLQDLNQIVRDAGLSLDGYVLTGAAGISDNGAVITGRAEKCSPTDCDRPGYILKMSGLVKTSTTTRLLVQVTLPGITLQSIVNQTFSTNVQGVLDGVSVFSRALPNAIDTSAGAMALTDATNAVRVTSGLRRLSVSAPTLIGTTTTVLSSTNSTLNVLTGTRTTTVTVTTTGPGTVAAGDLGICATPAADGIPPTGCSLPGTTFNVIAGSVNANIYTNTINSITPTTTPTVSQLITAEWRVSVVTGNQIGTVHAQSAIAGFDQGTRFTALMLGGGSAADVDPRGVEVASLDPVAVPVAEGWYAFGEGFGAWTDYDADPVRGIAASDSSLTGFSAGVAGSAGEGLLLGAAVQWARSEFDVHDLFAQENLTVELTQLGLFGAWQSDSFTLAGSVGYGDGMAETVIGNQTVGLARSRKDETLWTVGLEARYDIDLGNVILTPIIGLNHVNVRLDGFTEAGTGPLLKGFESDAERTRFYTGVDVVAQWGATDRPVTLALTARAFNDSGDRDGLADLAFIAASSAHLAAHGPTVGRWGAELGAGLAITVGDRTDVFARYDGQYREGAQTHAVSAGFRIAF